jgi:spectrin alpha
LEQSLAYQQFSTNVDEEESWINEKNTVVVSDDYGDTLAAAQVSLETSIALGFIKHYRAADGGQPIRWQGNRSTSLNTCVFLVQGLLTKHDAFEKDFEVHKERVKDIENVGQGLLADVSSYCNGNPLFIISFSSVVKA